MPLIRKHLIRKNISILKQHITTIFVAVVMCLLSITACNDKPEITESISNRSKMPKLKAYAITTLVSDSGITRYRISAQRWLIFDKDTQPHWDFPDGIYFERFNESYEIDAFIESDKAKYLEKKQLWQLDGNVVAQNLNGEKFETQQMFWDQRNEKIYSDSLIKITQKEKIIIGYSFESNQNFTRYLIRNPQGIFPIDEDKKEQ